MGFWQKIFGRGKRKVEEKDSWEEIVNTREQVNFHVQEERNRYITDCLEQMKEASREMEQLKGEYSLVTSYLTDMEELEAVPDSDKEEVLIIAGKLQSMEAERLKYRSKEHRMLDLEYYQLKKQENELEEGIAKLKENEKYHELVKQDLNRLNAEKHAYEYRKSELYGMLANFKGMAIIFLSAFVMCIVILSILQFLFQMNAYIGFIISVMAVVITIAILCVKYMDLDRELSQVEQACNRLVQLQNTVKIRYVNNVNLLDYLYLKYNVDSAKKLEIQWEQYQQEKEERKQFAEAESKIEYYQKKLIKNLMQYRIKTPERWIHQVEALLNKNEMIEVRHEMILRRQALRSQLDYNTQVAENAKNEIKEVVHSYPMYAKEILKSVERVEKDVLISIEQ